MSGEKDEIGGGMRHALHGVMAAVAALVLATGCGTSSDDPPAQDHLLQGAYHYVSVTTTMQTIFVRSEVGTCQADGAGNLTFEGAYSAEEGTLAGPFTPPPGTYTVGGMRDLTVLSGSGALLRGRVAADGSVAESTAREAGDAPAMLILVRSAGVVTAADLAGTWHLVHWFRSPNPSYTAFSGVGKLTIDPAGHVTITQYSYNRDEVIDPAPPTPAPMMVVPNADGGVLWQHAVTSAELLRGGLSPDRNVMLLGMTESGYAGIQMLIRADLDVDESDLLGDHDGGGVGLVLDPPPGMACFWGPFDANGSGGARLGFDTNTHGELIENPTSPVGYSVDPDGGFHLWIAGPADLRGAALPGGRCAMVGGPMWSGAMPMFQLLVR